jgi:hypothetical protein
MKRIVTVFVILTLLAGMAMVAQAQDTIPKGFKGDDIVAVVKALQRGTFHQHKYISTVNKEDIERVYTFKVSDDVVLSSPAGVWIEDTTQGINVYALIKEENLYLIKDMGGKKKNWTGQNVFGARARVESESETKYFVLLDRNIRKLPVKPIGGKVGVLFIGKPMEADNRGVRVPRLGYVAYVGQSYRPTFDMPYETDRKYYGLRLNLREVVVYDQDTGKVLLRQKP